MLGMPQVAVPWTAVGQNLPVTGVRSGINAQTGEVPARRDINSLYDEGGPQWDLYVGALTAMQDANETDPVSFFQIAGKNYRVVDLNFYLMEQTQGIVRTIKCYSAPGIVRIFHCMSKSLCSMPNDSPPPTQPHQEDSMSKLPRIYV
ncbi:Tyrosinase [Colletotrichum sp. SAR 10_65]|nr:Tyrosinase [Colletotrichum sp. SAR 10_65]KAJ5000763.1 Tyrosinase [Colletotrichum sp. SAR 10_66]